MNIKYSKSVLEEDRLKEHSILHFIHSKALSVCVTDPRSVTLEKNI